MIPARIKSPQRMPMQDVMRVLVADYWNDPFTAHLVRALAQRPGLEVTYLSRFGMDRGVDALLEGSGVRLLDRFAPMRRWLPFVPYFDVLRWGLQNQLVLLHYMRRLRPDVVHLQHFGYWTEPLALAFRHRALGPGGVLIRTVHDVFPHRWLFRRGRLHRAERAWLCRVMRAHDHLVVHTERGAKLLRRYCRAPAVTRIHLGIAPLRPVAAAREPVFLILGNLRENKNIHGVVAAWQRLPQALRRRWTLRIRGRSPASAQAYRERIEAAIARDPLGIDYRNGYVSEESFDELLEGAAYLLLAYRGFESQSGVVMRAVESSTPVICSREAAFTELLDDGVALFTGTGAAEIAATLERAAAEGLAGARARGAAMARIQAANSWELSAARHEALYRRLLAGVPAMAGATGEEGRHASGV